MYKESFFFTYFSVNNFYLSSNKVFPLRFVTVIPHTAGALCAVGQKQAKAPAYRLFHKICVTLQAERNTEFMRLSPTGPWRPFLLLLPTCLALIGMRYMPQVYIGPYEVKGVDLLADVMPDEIVIIEYPNLNDNSIASSLLNLGTVNLMVTRANRTWKDIDQKALKEVMSQLENKDSLYMYLTEASRYAVEEFVGQLPPYTKFNNFVYRISQLGLTAQENNHAN